MVGMQGRIGQATRIGLSGSVAVGGHDPQLGVIFRLLEAIEYRPVAFIIRILGIRVGVGVVGVGVGIGVAAILVDIIFRRLGGRENGQGLAVGRPPVGIDAVLEIGHRSRLAAVQGVDPDLGGSAAGGDVTEGAVGTPIDVPQGILVVEGQTTDFLAVGSGQP